MRPSIIFFDEMDGLAPVRSSRQDQIHRSEQSACFHVIIVSSLAFGSISVRLVAWLDLTK